MTRSGERFKKRVMRADGVDRSPRPHPVSILLGALSPVLGIAALAISYFGYGLSTLNYELSRASLEVAQRAYVAAYIDSVWLTWDSDDLNGFEVKDAKSASALARSIRERDDTCSPTVHAIAKIINSGNTPATIDDSSLEVETRHADGQRPDFGANAWTPIVRTGLTREEMLSKGIRPNVAELALFSTRQLFQRETQTTTVAADFVGDKSSCYEAAIALTNAFMGSDSGRLGLAVLRTKVKYTDVFGKTHSESASWCAEARSRIAFRCWNE